MKITSRTDRPRLRQPAVLAWLRLARVFQKIDTRSEQFFRTHQLNTDQFKLNTAHFDVLAQVGAARGMTEQGQALFDIVVPQQEALIADLLAPLSDAEQRELLRLLRKLDHSITT